MNKEGIVYVLMSHPPWESPKIVGIFTTEAKAQECRTSYFEHERKYVKSDNPSRMWILMYQLQ